MPQRERKLVCRYRTGRRNPLVLFKEEVEWDQPTIVRYHDFLSEGEIDTIKTLARPKVCKFNLKGTLNAIYVALHHAHQLFI